MTGAEADMSGGSLVTTVLGRVGPASLGSVDAHEHVFIAAGPLTDAYADFRIDDEARAIVELGAFRASGGGTVVDMIPIGLGRDPEALVRISRESGVHIVAATGFHRVAHYPSGHWLHRYHAEDIAQLLVEDLVDGIDRNDYTGPRIDRSAARAGVIKVAADLNAIPPVVEKLIHAVGLAHRVTGAPISTHSEKGTALEAQVDKLAEAGVAPTSVMLGHTDRNPRVGELRAAASTGAALIVDGLGRGDAHPEAHIIRTILELVDAGHAERLLLGMDFARRRYWEAWGGAPGMRMLLGSFAPRLLAAGLEASALELMLVTNPARMLTARTSIPQAASAPA